MKIAAVVAEYNPFHKGHAHQLQAARERGVTHAVVIMGGNFLQRGAAALLEKRVRAEAALSAGADLVVELPLPYALATAERFAFGAVSLAGALGCVEALSFGCENADIQGLADLASLLEQEDFSHRLRLWLQRGVTFAAARQQAATELLGPEKASLLERPNNILAIEYLRQVGQLGLALEPIGIARVGQDHDALGVQSGFASATHIRSIWGRPEAMELVPESCRSIYLRAGEAGLELDPLRLETAVLSALRPMSRQQLATLPDLSEGLENRLYSAIRQGCTVEEICRLVKTKRYPLARIRRLVFAAFLQVEGDLCHRSPPYLRVLGYNHRGLEILARAKSTASIPISDSLARLRDTDDCCRRYAVAESSATDRYTACLKIPRPCGYDYTANPIRFK